MTKIKPTLFLVAIMLMGILQGCLDSDIKSVRESYTEFDTSTTLGDALEGNEIFTSIKWREFKDKQKRRIVEFKGAIKLAFVGETKGYYVLQFLMMNSDVFDSEYDFEIMNSGIFYDGVLVDEGLTFDEIYMTARGKKLFQQRLDLIRDRLWGN